MKPYLDVLIKTFQKSPPPDFKCYFRKLINKNFPYMV